MASPPPDWTMRPARDHGLTPGERLRSHQREPGLSSIVLASLWRGAVRAYLRVAHRLTIEGRANLPPAPFVMIANHSSHLDALTLAAALPRRLAHKAFALAAGDTFFTSTSRAAFAAFAVNALPVWRRRTSAADLDGLRARLTEDAAIFILFPEGTRSRTGTMGRFRPGIAALVAGTAIPVVPCWLQGAHAAWPPGRHLPRSGKLHLRIGTPLHFPAPARTKPAMAEITAACEQAVQSLAPGRGAPEIGPP